MGDYSELTGRPRVYITGRPDEGTGADFGSLVDRKYVLPEGSGQRPEVQARMDAATTPGFGELKAKEYTPSERIGNAVRDAMMAAGARPQVANHLTEGLGGILGLTPVGMAGSAIDTVDAQRRRDPAGVIEGMAGMIPGAGGEARAVARELPAMVRGAEEAGTRISPRLPTAVKSTEDPLGANRLQIDLASMKQDPVLFDHNVGLVRNYPNLPLADRTGTADEVAEKFIEHAKGNLLALHDAIPAETRPRSSLWYEGGNKIANDLATAYTRPGANRPLSPASSAAAIAALSPQKDWFMNVDLARRVHDIHFTKSQEPWSPKMEATAGRIFGDKKYASLLDSIRGTKYNELDLPAEKAMWLRTYDEAHNDRSHRLVTPEGNFGDKVLTAKGVPSGTGWGSLGEIAKAIQALEADGDVAKISGLMGERHKVRSFYNNIIDPHSDHGDVTMDTHAVAAALMRPLSGNSLEVAHNFNNYAGKGLTNAKGSSVTGVQGTYPLYAEAYRRAAAERGILPRQMQSITWEGVRGLFPDTFKNKANNEAIDNIWRQHRDGVLSADEARALIFEKAGGINPPDWHGK